MDRGIVAPAAAVVTQLGQLDVVVCIERREPVWLPLARLPARGTQVTADETIAVELVETKDVQVEPQRRQQSDHQHADPDEDHPADIQTAQVLPVARSTPDSVAGRQVHFQQVNHRRNQEQRSAR